MPLPRSFVPHRESKYQAHCATAPCLARAWLAVTAVVGSSALDIYTSGPKPTGREGATTFGVSEICTVVRAWAVGARYTSGPPERPFSAHKPPIIRLSSWLFSWKAHCNCLHASDPTERSFISPFSYTALA